LSLYQNPFAREYDEKWTRDVFKISQRILRGGLPVYRIKDFNDDEIKGTSQQTDKISQQQENWENRNGPDFPKKWWVESDFTAPNLPLPLRLKDSCCHCINIFNNTGTN
jgi:hypothetical protein